MALSFRSGEDVQPVVERAQERHVRLVIEGPDGAGVLDAAEGVDRAVRRLVVLPGRALAQDAGELGAEAVVGLAVPDLAHRLPVDVPQLLALEDAAGGHGAGGADDHRMPADQAVALQPRAGPRRPPQPEVLAEVA